VFARLTLLSYGIMPPSNPDAAEQVVTQRLAEVLLPGHQQFLRNLKRSFTCGDFFFVHAGVRLGVPLSQRVDEDSRNGADEGFTSQRSNVSVIRGYDSILGKCSTNLPRRTR
jgi:hypothetical protein